MESDVEANDFGTGGMVQNIYALSLVALQPKVKRQLEPPKLN